MKNQSRFKLLIATIVAVFFNTVVGCTLAAAAGLPPVAGAVTLNIVMAGVGEYALRTGAVNVTGIFMAGLAREVYLSLLLKKYRPNPAWMKECRDLSAYVSNDVINLADAGADPGIIVNYDGTYDIPVAADEDSPVALALKTLSTEQSQVKWNAQRTRAYDIAADRVERHALTLMQSQGILSAYGIAPDVDGAQKFVNTTTGDADGSGFKAMKVNDFIDIKSRFLNADMSLDNGIVGVLHPTHLASLQKEDAILFKPLLNAKPGDMVTVLGIDCYISTQTPLYNSGTGARKAYGAVAAPVTDAISSFFFIRGEAGFARGTLEAFVLPRNPTRQSDFYNFAVAFFGGNIRGKGIGAVYSAKA